MKKPLILFFTLAIPVAIFLFLKFFGENTYEVPIFFENGIEGCVDSPQPFVMDFSQLFEDDESDRAKNLTVVALVDTLADENLKPLITELIQIQDAFYGKAEPNFVLVSENASPASMNQRLDLCAKAGLKEETVIFKQFPPDQLEDFLRCGLGLTNGERQNTDLVLVDTFGRVRGFYPRHDAEQTDRLILELKIIVQQK